MSKSTFNYEALTPENAAILFIDHQTGLMTSLVNDISEVELKNNVLALAKVAKIHKLPTILTTSNHEGPNGPLMPELVKVFPDVKVIRRPGTINVWDYPEFVSAVKATKRKKLIMAGITTDVCVVFPALSAVSAGYDVYAVIDASGTLSQTVQNISIMRLAQAGVNVINWFAVAAELQADWRKSTGNEMAQLFSEHLIRYGMIITNWLANRPEQKVTQ